MNYTTKREGDIVKLVVTVGADEWKKEIEQAYEATKGKYKVEGFRPGKAPQKVLENTYGAGIFIEEALQRAWPKYYMEVLNKEKSIEPIDYPTIDFTFNKDGGISIMADIDVLPSFEIKAYKGISVKGEKINVDKKQIDEQLEQMQSKRSRAVAAAKDAKIQNGNIAIINFEGFVDGVAFAGGKAENYNLEIGSKSFIDTFEEQLVGLQVGDKKDINVSFPKEYHAKELAGKPSMFKVEIKNILVKEVPTLDDTFAKDSSEFNTLAELKADIKATLEADAKVRQEAENQSRVIEAIVKDVKLTPPTKMVERQEQYLMQDLEQRLAYQGANITMYSQIIGKSVEEIKADLSKQAVQTVKTRLVLDKILDLEKIDVTKAEIDAEIEKIAKSKGTTTKEFLKGINEKQLGYIENNLLFDKLSKFLVENNKITD